MPEPVSHDRLNTLASGGEPGAELASAQTIDARIPSEHHTAVPAFGSSVLGSLGALPARDLLRRLQDDQRRRWKRGERFLAESYREQLPVLRDDAEGFLDLVYHEILLREDLGETPTLDEYRRRMPEHADALGRLLDLHQQLGDSDFGASKGATGASTPTPQAPSSSAAGDVDGLPGYEILSVLGRGGMGVVYKARQLDLNRLVALKMVLSGSHAEAIDLVRFRSEAEVTANLLHPNIVQVFEIGKHEGLPYLSMEFVGGGTLSQMLDGEPLLPQNAAPLLETIAQAVHHAHRHGIVHRDIKPSNILVSAEGQPKVTDFGLAKRFSDEHGMTITGAILGTPSYMAPEQAEGKKEVGPAADVYALGVILYEMLTGRPPFRAPTPVETIRQVISEEPVSPRRLQPKLPRDLETICLKCLQKEPAKRYTSAEALADDLARFRENRPIQARPVSMIERSQRWCRRNPLVASLSGVLVACVAAAFILLSHERSRTLENLNRAVQFQHDAQKAEEETKKQLEKTVLAENERAEQLWRSQRDTAEARRFSHQVGQRYESIKALTQATQIARSLGKGDEVLLELRNKAIASFALRDLRLVKELPRWSNDLRSYDIDDAFEQYILADGQGAVSLRRVFDGSEVLRLPGIGTPRTVLSLSPNGRCFVVDNPSNRSLQIWDAQHKERADAGIGLVMVSAFAFSADSKRFVFFSERDGQFAVYNLETRVVERRWKGTGPTIAFLACHPDGLRFAAFIPGAIQIWTADSGQLISTIKTPGSAGKGAWNRDGRSLGVWATTNQLRVQLWDIANRRQIGALEGHKNAGVHAAFSPLDDMAASNSWDALLRLWEPGTSRQILTLSAAGCRFNRAGDRMLLYRKNLEFWEVADGDGYRTFVGDPIRGKQVPYLSSISPDGRLLAAGSDSGAVIWDLTRGIELAHLPVGRTFVVLFHPSGDLLVSSVNRGLERWPIRANPDAAGEYQIGPAKSLTGNTSTDGVGQSKDGTIIGVALSGSGGQIIDLNQPGATKPLLPHVHTNKIAVSPDGRWAATGTHHGTGIYVWSVPENKLERVLPIEGGAIPYFSPDGRWLATANRAELRLWKVGDWGPGPKVPDGDALFSPDERLLAVRNNFTVTLVDLATGRTLAALEDPNQDRAGDASFSPDGTLIAVSTRDSYSIHVWDLRKIRAQLKAIGLDWDMPDFPPAAPPGPAIGRIKVAGQAGFNPLDWANWYKGVRTAWEGRPTGSSIRACPD